MIHSTRPTVQPIAITIVAWKIFCEIWKSGDGRTDNTCENSDHYRPLGSICDYIYIYYFQLLSNNVTNMAASFPIAFSSLMSSPFMIAIFAFACVSLLLIFSGFCILIFGICRKNLAHKVLLDADAFGNPVMHPKFSKSQEDSFNGCMRRSKKKS